jgi:hypothetical protein
MIYNIYSHNIKIANRLFANASEFTYFGTTVTNQNLIHEEIRRRLNSGSADHHSFQNHLPSCVLLKNIIIRIYKIIVLAVFLYGY